MRVSRERPGLCGPFALAALLRFYGDRVSLPTLARLCRATRARGTTPDHLATAARARGFQVRTKRWADIADLARVLHRGLPPIVLWFSEDEGHYSIVVGLDPRSVALADPELGRIRRLSRQMFRRVWFDFSTSGPEKGATLYARWMLVVEPGTSVRSRVVRR